MLRVRSRLTARLRVEATAARHASASSILRAPAVALKVEDDLPGTPTARSVPMPPRSMLNLPTMIPVDQRSGNANANPDFPMLQVALIDAASMINICLRRKDSIPRAFNIFAQLLRDADKGIKPPPDTAVWSKIIEGLVTLACAPDSDARWMKRVEKTLQRWEKRPETSQPKARLDNDGIKVYRGLLMGYVRCNASPTALLPYIENDSLPIDELLGGIQSADQDSAFASLSSLARAQGMSGVLDIIDRLQNRVVEQREAAVRSTTPEIVPVPAKQPGRGQTDPENASNTISRFAVSNLRKALDPINSSASPMVRQRALEAASLDAAAAELEHSAQESARRQQGSASALARPSLQSWMHDWLLALEARLIEDLDAIQSRLKNRRSSRAEVDAEKFFDLDQDEGRTAPRLSEAQRADQSLQILLTVLSPKKLALATIIEMMRTVGQQGMVDSVKTVRAIVEIGKTVEAEYHAETIQNVNGANSKMWRNLLDGSQQPSKRFISSAWDSIGNTLQQGSSRVGELDWGDFWTPSWTREQHIALGGHLLAALVDVAKVQRSAINPRTGETVTEEQPAFSHTYEYAKGKKLGVVRLNPVVSQGMATDHIPSLIRPKSMPMLVEPRKWETDEIGGYLSHRTSIMRLKDSPEQSSYLKEATKAEHLEPVLHALDVLSSTPWKINRFVFDVMLKNWNEGTAIAEIPASPDHSEFTLPPKPDSGDKTARAKWQGEYKLALLNQRRDHGRRCGINYTLEIARAFLHDTFYLPHNMDFRGRAYPIPPHLSPVGDDLNRGLLIFGEGKPLGKTGLRWLYIHLANKFGFDKMSFDDRARFAEDHIADILDSADRPSDGDRWWLRGEDPWQCLATCKEIADAIRSPNPEEFVSSLPVHQDGTCNGMQHYAALGGDVRGARAVNLEDGDRPADIYTRVVDIVNRVIEQDKKRGLHEATLIKEPLTRKVVKQTVMTTVYGVTFVGARDQIAKQLVSRTDILPADVYIVSAYVAKTVLSCIGDLFSGARDIQDWLTLSARLICRSIAPSRIATLMGETQAALAGDDSPSGEVPMSKMRPHLIKELMSAVIWTTPLGLPVVQPYRRKVKKQVLTALQTVYVHDPYQATEVSTLKQTSAFPPNFIHSLDATHMFMTALSCRRHGLTFAAVHDSYWTHAASVDTMSDLIRDAFIGLHTQDLIGELRAEFLERCGENYIFLGHGREITRAARVRQEKEKKRRSTVRAVLDESSPDPSDKTTVNLVNAEVDVLGQEPTLPEAPEQDIGLTLEDLEAVSAMKRSGQRTTQNPKFHFIGGHTFVQLKDLLPPTPPRGEFDVEKTRTSQYFFS